MLVGHEVTPRSGVAASPRIAPRSAGGRHYFLWAEKFVAGSASLPHHSQETTSDPHSGRIRWCPDASFQGV